MKRAAVELKHAFRSRISSPVDVDGTFRLIIGKHSLPKNMLC